MSRVGGNKGAISSVRVTVIRGVIPFGKPADDARWTWAVSVILEGGETLSMDGEAGERSAALSFALQAIDVLDALNRLGASSSSGQGLAVMPVQVAPR